MKKIIVFCVAFLATMSLWASRASVNAIWYNFDSRTKTASVTDSRDHSDKYTGEVVIPSTVMYKGEEYNVTEIGNHAFQDCSSLISITIPESVTEIGGSAFSGCTSLTSITIPDGVTEIGSCAFSDCSSLTSIDVASNNNNYTSIDGVLFSKDKTILIQYPGGKATSYIIPDGVTEIGGSAFSGCRSLTSITIPESVTEIGGCAFSGCRSLTSITIPDGVTEIGSRAFWGCSSLTSIDVASNNNNYTSIDGVVFSKDKTILIKYPKGKDATSYIIPDGVMTIGDEAFANCRSLRSVTIPSGVTTIGNGAFNYCTGFTSITCKKTTPPILEFEFGNYTFEGVDTSIPLYVPAESVEVYKNTKYWKEFTNIQAIPSSSVANAKAETQDFVRKEYRDGQVLIIKGDKTYTMFGTEY